MSAEKRDDLKVFGELKGNTLRVYLFMVENRKPIGIREVQKKLEFSSPTLAAYHLEKLENLGLIIKAPNGYSLTKEVKIGTLSQIVKFGSLLLPRYTFYTVFFSAMLICYLALRLTEKGFILNVDSGFALLLGISAIAVMSYECLRIVRQRIV